jgi:hypothetical protein
MKSPKFYFYDTGQVLGNEGIKLENLTACALLKESQYLEDCYGEEFRLHYLMTKDGRELDFFVIKNGDPFLMAEIKWADANLSRNFYVFDKYFSGVKKLQIVGKLDREKTFPSGVEIRSAHKWLAHFSLR